MSTSGTTDSALVSAAKRVLPERAKDVGKVALRSVGVATSPLRGLPDYLIIGAKRCGTTSMHNYLLSCPDVAPLFPQALHVKGAHYFDRQFDKPLSWYRSFFPVTGAPGRADGLRRLSGEASPNYFIHPYAPKRAARVVPHARIIAQLRDPAERAYSQYRDEVKAGNETLSFADALAAEPERMAPELARMAQDEHYYSFAHEHLAYRAQSMYADNLERWLAYFPREQVYVLRSEDLFARPAETFAGLTSFLGLPPYTPPGGFRQYNASPPARDADTVQQLREELAPHTARLATVLGQPISW